MANHFPVLQVSRAGLTVISVPADVRTQAMYQMMDQGFVGLIFSCFIEDKNTKVDNLKMATKPPGAREKHQGRAESLGAACKKGRALLGAHGKHSRNGGGWIVIPRTGEQMTIALCCPTAWLPRGAAAAAAECVH